MKEFAVIGIGRFGESVAKSLNALGCEVLAVDKDEKKVAKLSNISAKVIQGDATDEVFLRDIDIQAFDTVIVGIGQNIEASIIITMLLGEYGISRIISKAKNRIHGKILLKVGAHQVVYPEWDMAKRVALNLISSKVIETIDLSHDSCIIEMIVPSVMEGKSLKELKLPERFGVTVLGIKQNSYLNFSPRAHNHLEKDDILFIFGKKESFKSLSTKLFNTNS